jgi:TP901 family phage tail tape measure protein
MSDRSVSVGLHLNVAGYIASVEQARLKTVDFAKSAEKSAATHKESWDKVGKGMLVTGGVIAAGVALEVKAFMDFDSAMSRAQAGTMATGASLKALRAAAIQAGADTQYSATEAADAITAMGKAGVSTQDILGGGLMGALDLAAAGQLDVATAAEIAATAMNQFGLSGKDIPHVADLLAAGAGKAMGSVEDLAGALKFVGPVSKGLNVSIEQTTGVLAEFAQQGIVGEMAGTSLRGMLLTLTSPSGIVAKKMEALGINVYDASGKFIGLQGAAGELQAKLGPLDNATRNAALGQIFGNEQVTAARILYEGGAPAVQQWTAKVNDAGYASRQAAMLTDNLKGDIERLSGSLSTVLINGGSAANGMLRSMTKNLQGVVDLYGSLPVPVQKGATVLSAVAGAATLVTGGMILMAPRIASTKAALEGMGRTGTLLSRGLSGTASVLKGPVGIALAAGVIGLGYFAKQAQESKARVDELTATLDQETGALTESTRATVNKRLSDDGSLALAKKMRIAVGDLSAAYLGNVPAQNRVTAAANAYAIAGGDAGDSMTNEASDAKKLKDMISGGSDETSKAVAAQKLLAEANKAGGSAAAGATGKTKALAGAQTDLGSAAKDAKEAIDKEVQSLQDAGLAVLSTRSATRALIDATAAATAAHKKNGDTLNVNTVKGRANQEALDAQANAALSLAKSIYSETGSEDKMRASLITSRASLVATGIRFGLTKKQANDYADSIIKMPPHHKTTVELDKAAADKKIWRLNKDIENIKQGKVPGIDANTKAGRDKIAGLQRQIDILRGKNISIDVSFNTATNSFINKPPTWGPVVNRAGGGPIDGVGTGTSDSNLILGSKGEHVLTADDVTAAGGHGAVMDWRKSLHKYAGGGPIVIGMPSGGALSGALGSAYPPVPSGGFSFNTAALGGGAGGAGKWASLVTMALTMLGQPASSLAGNLRRINLESRGNPHAINLTDSNAAAGHPSMGLMQTIIGTFMAYAGPFAGRGPYDPFASIYAGDNYAIHRYGSVAAVDPLVHPGGYDTGGVMMPGGVGANYGNLPERVLSGRQTESFDRLVAVLTSGAARSGGRGGAWSMPDEADSSGHGGGQAGGTVTNTTTFNAYGLDADEAVQRAMREWEFRAVPR